MIKKILGIFVLLAVLLNLDTRAQTPWTQKANFPGTSRAYDVAFSIGEYGFVGCGTHGATYFHDFYKYNEYTNTWTAIANYPGLGQFGCIGFTCEGKGYVAMGWNGSASQNDMWEYDTITNTWTAKANFPGTARYSCFPFIIGHKAYFVGGSYNGPPYLNDVWVYDTHANTWTQLSNFPGGDIESYISFAIGKHGYVGDGYWNPGCYEQMYEYDTTSDTWTTSPNIPVAYGISGNPTPWIIGSKAYLSIGSVCTSEGLRDGWVFDTVTNSWCEYASMASAKISRGLAVTLNLNNHGYLSTGFDTNLNELADLWEYTPSVNFITSDTTVCSGDSVHFSNSSTYYSSAWNWSFPGGSPATSNLQNPSVVYSNSGSFAVSFTLTACDTVATITRQVNVTINPAPVINFSGKTSICASSSDTLSASGGGTYAWSTGATTSSIIVSPASDKTYTLAVTKNGCSKDTSVTINVSPLPSITFSGNNPICSGDSTTITATGGGTYLWNTGATTSSVSVMPLTTTTYSVLVNNGGCKKDSSVKITVSPVPVITLGGRDSVCVGNSTTLTVSGGTSYLWSTGATTSSITKIITADTTYTVQVSNGVCTKDTAIKVTANPLPSVTLSGNNILCAGDSTVLTASGGISYTWSTSATTSSITVKPATTSTYTVGVSNGACVKDTNIKVTVNPLPNITIAGATAVCLGDSATLTASGGGTYLWSTSSTSSAITVKPIANTTYTVTVTNSNNCSKDTTITVSVNTLTAGINGPISICYGDTATLLASGGGTYHWSTGSTQSSISVTPASTTTYTATITKGACVKDTTVTVTVNPLPVAVITGNSPICTGSSATLTASGGTGYLWNSGQTTSVIIVIPTSTTTYTVTVTNSSGCKKDTTFQVKVAVPDGVVNGPSSLCIGDSATLTASGGGTYQWSTGSTKNSITITPATTTTYSVTVNNGCIDTVTKVVSIVTPALFACCDTTILVPGTSVYLEASGASNYYWTPPAGLSCDSCPDPVVNPTVTTTYTVLGTDSAGCKVERTVTVDVSSCLNPASIPNVFTPNSMNTNAVFYIDAQSVNDFSITIYDRWGKVMYSSTNPNTYWTGVNQKDNTLVSDGVYYYILKYTCSNKSYTKDGFVQVIR